ncbi:iron-only hydrogenase maturation protein HydE [Thermodesulfitimonas autotrophica]|uniref:Iron-only hydrogenase maturation protein HydE n=1 Tax=Thermodesulfitimonas autotrophica TaxID=1894989 RepID=A0A3N5AAL5_9THEO|nr:[FeFe] hydrogenase H-cluster radical SAM maturase HydE [Thermodesulfitimonas autotrophica]RPF42639.1 iron-only hydrogenase maturation protein HydE [Thermodesulfitimonas autotrophica]
MSAPREEFAAALAKAVATSRLEREEIILLLNAQGEEMEALCQAADAVRAKYLGRTVHLRAVIEFSNYCVRNCFYCGLRRDNRRLSRYRMTPAEIFTAARRARAEGFRTVVLQAGEDPSYHLRELCRLVYRLKSELDVAVTLSVGDLSREAYRELRAAGADRYLLKHETADPALFASLRPGTTFTARVKRLHWLRELGYQVGSGNIVGLPGQTIASLAADILLLKELDVEMAGIGPFIPHPATPLGAFPPGSLSLTLKVLAVTRLLLPLAHLPATTAVATLSPEGRRRALKAGANVVMPDLTPFPYRQHYAIYPGKTRPRGEGRDAFRWWQQELAKIGREVDCGYGHSPKATLIFQ